jgi:nitrate reductase NapAB chaperone NapD
MVMPIVGALARVEFENLAKTRDRLNALSGVETFDLDQPGKIGILIEVNDLDAAHTLVATTIPQTEGVMGVWPVFVNNEDAVEAARDPAWPAVAT